MSEKNNKPVDLKTRVHKFLSDNPNYRKVDVVSHFTAEACGKSIVYKYIKSYEEGQPAGRKIGSGRPPIFATKANIKKLETMFENKDGISLRKAGRRLKCDHTTVKKILDKHTNIRCYKKTPIPDRTPRQKKEAPSKFR